MKGRHFLLPGLLALFLWMGNALQSPGLAVAKPAAPSLCGPYGGPRDLVEPPNVEVWKLPLNAGG